MKPVLLVAAILFILAGTCGESGDSTPQPEVWADCPGVMNDFQICKGCTVIEQFTTDVARYGRIKDNLTGWERRVAIPKNCYLAAR